MVSVHLLGYSGAQRRDSDWASERGQLQGIGGRDRAVRGDTGIGKWKGIVKGDSYRIYWKDTVIGDNDRLVEGDSFRE